MTHRQKLNTKSNLQVHGATLHDGRRVVMKIQYPGVARSIESDVDNLLRIISLANILPKGMYIENAAKVSCESSELIVLKPLHVAVYNEN